MEKYIQNRDSIVLIKILDVEKVKKKYIHRCGEEDAGTVASGSASSQA
jgi:hypothetical protein